MLITSLFGNAGSSSGGSFACGVLAALAIVQLVVVLLNPRGVADRFFALGQRHYRIGELRQGIWNIAKSARQFRLMVGIADGLLAIVGIYFAIVLR